jgi:heme-degrading monooxygenase HmoA
MQTTGREGTIARIWHGTTSAEKGQEYLDRMSEVAITDYSSTPGNRGAMVLHRVDGDVWHFLTVSFWDSTEAIAAFAGDDIAAARYYAFDEDYLLSFEPTVEHYEVTR